MSADLFAEFNSLSSPSPAPPPQQSPVSTISSQHHQTPTQGQGHGQSYGHNGSFGSVAATGVFSPQFGPSSQAQSNISTATWSVSSPAPSKSGLGGGQVQDEDDGWGDFEVAEPVAPVAPQSAPFPTAFDDWSKPVTKGPEPPSRTRIVRASTFDLLNNNLVDIEGTKNPPVSTGRAQPEPQPVKPRHNDSNVLFDVAEFELGDDDLKADDNDDSDDFGDFETVGSGQSRPVMAAQSTTSPPPSRDLLSLDEPPSQAPPKQPTKKQPPAQLSTSLNYGAIAQYPQAPKSPSFQERNPYPTLAIRPPAVAEASKPKEPGSATPITAWPSIYDQKAAKKPTTANKAAKISEKADEWAAWEDFIEEDKTSNKQDEIDKTRPPESWDWDAVDNVQPMTYEADVKPSTSSASDVEPPPINVPPPAILLSAFPDILNSGGTFLKPISKQNASVKQQVLKNPKTAQFLNSYILLATTAARIIAGRKHRWHRDKILAKSMSISAAGSKGMKLAGVDKTQSAREDREAADVVAVWQENVGRVRAAVAAANAAEKSALKVPELSDHMHVYAAKLVPVANKPCVVCGLKREERITKVDFDVEDSFGEWWVEHWGHRACKNFWVEHEQQLRQR
ncbi:hypothetical protein S40288_04039 [Stachybotrys chartarum IBT 40288]|nr:hypothetical protein S40288_04039 [Stachybotrys chartarum IBT 40288]